VTAQGITSKPKNQKTRMLASIAGFFSAEARQSP
jgi:hypothetical protein